MLTHPLVSRVGAAPVELIQFIELVHAATNKPTRPSAASVPPAFLSDVQDAIEEMPDVVKHILARKLMGVYFVRGLGCSAVTDVVLSQAGALIGGIVALDPDALMQRSANDWITWKENTPFVAAPGISIEAFIAAPQDDRRKNALQYLLLHEFGHVLSAGASVVPDWWRPESEMQATEAYDFLRLGWRISAEKTILPLPKNDFALRERIVYYADAQLSGGHVPQVYASLQETNFVTLYAACNVFDDFAESFASYVHSALMQKPYVLQVRSQDRMLVNLDYERAKIRCADKFQFMGKFVKAV